MDSGHFKGTGRLKERNHTKLWLPNVQFQKISYTTQGRLSEIPRRRGVSKAQFFKGKYDHDAKLEFLEGWRVQAKNRPSGDMYIFLELHNLGVAILI